MHTNLSPAAFVTYSKHIVVIKNELVHTTRRRPPSPVCKRKSEREEIVLRISRRGGELTRGQATGVVIVNFGSQCQVSSLSYLLHLARNQVDRHIVYVSCPFFLRV